MTSNCSCGGNYITFRGRSSAFVLGPERLIGRIASRHENKELISFARHDRHRKRRACKIYQYVYECVYNDHGINSGKRSRFKCVIEAKGAYRDTPSDRVRNCAPSTEKKSTPKRKREVRERLRRKRLFEFDGTAITVLWPVLDRSKMSKI